MNFVAAFLYAISTSALLALVLAFARGGLDPFIAGSALSFGAAVAACTLWSGRHLAPGSRRISAWEWAAILSFTLFGLRSFLWLVFRDGNSLKVLSPNNLGDLSLHITYIQFLAAGAPFWPDNPIFTGGKLTYPIGVDLCNALLALVGIDLVRGLVWIGLLGCAATGIALWRWGRGIALIGFLCNGGLFGFAYFRHFTFEDFQGEMAWKSLPLALFVTQRGLLYALPAGLLLLCSWRARLFKVDDLRAWRLPRWGEVLLYASLPLFHLHTFLFLSLLLGSWVILHPPARRDLALLIGAALLPASALVLLVTGMFKGSSMLGWKAGWMADDPAFLKWLTAMVGERSEIFAAPLFWLLNFGILPFLVLALCFQFARRSHHIWPPAVVFPAMFIFLLCCFVKFAPWEWDNTKLMLWSYLAVLPFVWSELVAHWRLPMRLLACFVLFWSGFASLIGGLDARHRGHEIARRSELDTLASALRGIPVTERFAGHPDYNHPLLLSGRKMALGYTGHAWSHGLDWGEVGYAIDELLHGTDDWRIHAADLQVRYLFWGEKEREHYKDSPQPWRQSFKRIAVGEWGELYDLGAPISAFTDELVPEPVASEDEPEPLPDDSAASQNASENQPP